VPKGTRRFAATVDAVGRSGQRCRLCGAVVADEAVYCPACGAATGRLRVEAVDGAQDGPATDVALGGPRRRWVGPAALAAVAAVVVGIVVVGGRGGGTSSPATTLAATTAPTTTVAPSTSTSAAATTTTSAYSRLSAGHAFEPGADGVVVYLGVRTNEIARVDLGAGTVERRSVTRPAGGPWMALGRRGGVVLTSAHGDQPDLYGLADGPASVPHQLASWHDAGGAGSTSPQAAPAAEPDEIWVWHEGGTDGTTVQRMRLDGTVTAGPVTLPKFAALIGPDGPGAFVMSGPDGLYRATVDGEALSIEHVWPRVPVVVTPTTFLDLVCSNELDCHLAAVDRVTGATRPAATPPDQLFSGYYAAFTGSDALSPDGRWLAHLEYSGQSPRLLVHDLVDGGVVVDRPIVGAFYGGIRSLPFTFSPDGTFLLFVDISGDLGVWPVGSPDPPHRLRVDGVNAISSMSLLP
jgi:hypothetical protein